MHRESGRVFAYKMAHELSEEDIRQVSGGDTGCTSTFCTGGGVDDMEGDCDIP